YLRLVPTPAKAFSAQPLQIWISLPSISRGGFAGDGRIDFCDGCRNGGFYIQIGGVEQDRIVGRAEAAMGGGGVAGVARLDIGEELVAIHTLAARSELAGAAVGPHGGIG